MDMLAGACWEPANERTATCLIVLCHGANATGDAMARMVDVVAGLLPGAAFAAPHGPLASVSRPPMREWFSPPYAEPHIGPRVVAAAASLDAFIDAQLAARGLPPDAYALGGFSQGAIVALHAGLRRAVPPRAIVAVAGVAVTRDLPLAPIRPPVLLIAGTLDAVVPPRLVRETERMLRDAGVTIEAHYVAGLGHEVTPPVIALGGAFIQRVFRPR